MTKNISGRKNDEDDAMWIQKLHSCGLLKSSYLPDDEQESLRTLVRIGIRWYKIAAGLKTGCKNL